MSVFSTQLNKCDGLATAVSSQITSKLHHTLTTIDYQFDEMGHEREGERKYDVGPEIGGIYCNDIYF